MGETEALEQISIRLAETLEFMKNNNMTVNSVYRNIEKALANCNLVIYYSKKEE